MSQISVCTGRILKDEKPTDLPGRCRRSVFAAVREAGSGPKRQFAAVQRHACNGSRSGQSAAAANTAVPDQ
jgi:hypothetical protein